MTHYINMPGTRSGCIFYQQRDFYLYLLCIWILTNLASGYFLNNCTIRGHLNDSLNMKVLCGKKNLVAVPINIPQNVSVLDLSINDLPKIGRLDFKGLSILKILDISSNQISEVNNGALGHLKALQELNLAHNKLTILSEHLFQGLANLSLLRLDNNLITTVESFSFPNLFSLKMVNLTKNKLLIIKELQTIVQLPHLQELYIGSNRFTCFHSRELSNTSLGLRLLDLSGNPLEIFQITADVLPHLETLDVAYCGQLDNWDVGRLFLRNVNTLNLSGIQMSFEKMRTVLQTVYSSLVHLRLYNIDKEKVKRLIDVACHIPTLRLLQVRYTLHNLHFLSEDLLQSCRQLTDLDMSENNIFKLSTFFFIPLEQLRALKLGHNRLYSVPNAIRNLPSLRLLDLSFNFICKLDCLDFTNLTRLTHLLLFRNQIGNIAKCVFKDLKELRVLEIGANKILNLNAAFLNVLPKLETLVLAYCKLSCLRAGHFKSLQSLKTLLLYDNQIDKMENGTFDGLGNLTELILSSNKISQDHINRYVFRGLRSLKTLDISSNYITYTHNANLNAPPFSDLTSLENLRIHNQRHKGMRHLPVNFLHGLKSLLVLKARNLNIKALHPDTFIHTQRLCFLDISSNELTAVSPELFHPIPRLNRLYLSKTHLQSLDFVIDARLNRVTHLRVSKNGITEVNETELRSLPALTHLDIQFNFFSCCCRTAWFIQWIKNDNQTQVVAANMFTCKYPAELKGTKVLDLDLQFCSVPLGLYYFIATSILVLLTLLASFTYHTLKWQVIYGYYLFLAFLYDNKQQKKPLPHGCEYDAFVSYNAHDEPWVLRELLPELEGQQGWKLCLHHRDFQPGKPIIENIVDAVYESRKTICVISRRYLESEWCSREIQVASFRLFDEQKDVLILVFLEQIPEQQLSPYHRIRKLVKRRTYLSWPRAGHHTGVFWQQLRLALMTNDVLTKENSCLSRGKILGCDTGNW